MAKDIHTESGASGADPNRYRTLANMVAYARALRTGESADGSLEEAFIYVNLKLKLSFYQRVMKNFADRRSTLSADEAYCMEAVFSLGRPTIGEFASYVQISPQNAAYKVNNLVKKGDLIKERDEEDKREYRLHVTDSFMDYFAIYNGYVFDIVERLRQRYPEEDVEKFTEMMNAVSSELTPEIASPGE